jgi:hypothetical protein
MTGERVEEAATLTGLAATPIQNARVSAGFYPYADSHGTQHTRVLALITSAHPSRRRRAA